MISDTWTLERWYFRLHTSQMIYVLSSSLSYTLLYSAHVQPSFGTLFWTVFKHFFAFFNFTFFLFSKSQYIPSFYWILLLCCSAGWALLAVQILVHLWYYYLLFHSNSTVLHSSTSACNTELLITLKSRSWLHSFGGSLLVTSFLLIGYIPVTWNHDTKFLLIILFMSYGRRVGKIVFGKLSLDFNFLCQVSRTYFHLILVSWKTVKSRSWHRCVAFGGRQMKIMFPE